MVNFIKKTIIVQAVKVADVSKYMKKGDGDVPHWARTAIEADPPTMYLNRNLGVSVQTFYGYNQCDDDGWIIQDVDGELRPCPADVFTASYEPYDPDGEETEGLSFNQALSALCSGKKVARKEWNIKRHIEHADGAMFCDGMIDVDRFEASFNSADILALDWYIVTD